MRSSRSSIPGVALPAAVLAYAVVALLLTGALAACGGKPTATPTPTKTPRPPQAVTPTATHTLPPPPTQTPTPKPTSTATVTATVTATPDTATSTPTPIALVTMGPDVNPLTGLKGDPAKLDRRPLAVKIPNYPPDARPQSGLSLADVVIEHEAEAHLTRFTAIFLGNDVNPDLGPLRSIRLVDSELVPIFRAMLVASGGHAEVKTRVTEGKEWAAGYQRIICPETPFLGDGGTMRRVAKEGRRYELTLYTDTDSLWELTAERGVNQRQDFADMWLFSESPPAGGAEATHLKVVYRAGTVEAEYHFNADTESYERSDVGQPLVDELTGEQIAPSNVLVLYAHHAVTDIAADLHDPDRTWYSVSIQLWGEGPAKLLRDGQVYDGKWIRENPQQPNDRLIIVDSQGQQIPLHPGPTWIQLVPLDGDVQVD